MTTQGRTIVTKPAFSKSLKEILIYLEDYSPQYARQFLLDLDKFIVNRIAAFPEGHPEYKWKPTPQREYRRAIFKKHYYLIYKLSSKRLELTLIVYAKRDLSSIEIEN